MHANVHLKMPKYALKTSKYALKNLNYLQYWTKKCPQLEKFWNWDMKKIFWSNLGWIWIRFVFNSFKFILDRTIRVRIWPNSGLKSGSLLVNQIWLNLAQIRFKFCPWMARFCLNLVLTRQDQMFLILIQQSRILMTG